MIERSTELSGTVALFTGGGSGTGRRTALRHAAESSRRG